jgi:hypothetical protein
LIGCSDFSHAVATTAFSETVTNTEAKAAPEPTAQQAAASAPAQYFFTLFPSTCEGKSDALDYGGDQHRYPQHHQHKSCQSQNKLILLYYPARAGAVTGGV